MMHGAIPFESAKLEALGSLLQVLRAAVALGLKDCLGMPRDEAPLIASSGLSVHPSPSVVGTRAIKEADISALWAERRSERAPLQSSLPG